MRISVSEAFKAVILLTRTPVGALHLHVRKAVLQACILVRSCALLIMLHRQQLQLYEYVVLMQGLIGCTDYLDHFSLRSTFSIFNT